MIKLEQRYKNKVQINKFLLKLLSIKIELEFGIKFSWIEWNDLLQ